MGERLLDPVTVEIKNQATNMMLQVWADEKTTSKAELFRVLSTCRILHNEFPRDIWVIDAEITDDGVYLTAVGDDSGQAEVYFVNPAGHIPKDKADAFIESMLDPSADFGFKPCRFLVVKPFFVEFDFRLDDEGDPRRGSVSCHVMSYEAYKDERKEDGDEG